MKNLIVDRRYSVLCSDPSLSFFSLSVSAKDVHTRALSVYFSALVEMLSGVDTPLKDDGVFAVSKDVYIFGKQMVGEYLLYAVGKHENIEELMMEMANFIDGKGESLEKMGKSFDKMAAMVPRIASLPSPIYALYKFVWEKLLHISASDDVDVMYLNKISLVLKRDDALLAFTSIDKYDSKVVDRPVLIIGDVPERYEFVDKLVSGLSYKGTLYLHPLRSMDDVIYGFLAGMWYEEKGYGVVYERIRDYLMLYVYGKDEPPAFPAISSLESYSLLWKEFLADPINRIYALHTAGHILLDEKVDAYTTDGWSDVMKTDIIVRGRDKVDRA